MEPVGPTLLGFNVIWIATMLSAVAAFAVLIAIYAATTVRDPMSRRIKALNDRREQLKAGITGRIQSLARAHSLLAEARWEGVELTGLAREEVAPYGEERDGRITLHGPRLVLKPAAAQSIRQTASCESRSPRTKPPPWKKSTSGRRSGAGCQVSAGLRAPPGR